MKKWIIAIAITLSIALPVAAQGPKNEGLVLSGSLISVTPDGTEGTDVKFKLKFYMQLRNDSTRTVIVLRPGIEDATIDFLDGLSPNNEGSTSVLRLQPWNARCYDGPCRKDPNPDFIRSLANATEPGGGFVVLEAGKYYEFIEFITIKSGYVLLMKPGQTYLDVRENTPNSDYPALRVSYHLPANKYSKETDLFYKIQERWKKIGHLVLDGNGDFTLRSEIILNQTGN